MIFISCARGPVYGAAQRARWLQTLQDKDPVPFTIDVELSSQLQWPRRSADVATKSESLWAIAIPRRGATNLK